ncbi:hypothetical protein Peur_011739 [Populus x canadensis]
MGVSSFPSSPSCFRKNGRATSSTTLHLVKPVEKKAPTKPNKSPAKPLSQLMEEDVIPSLEATLEAQDHITELELSFEDKRVGPKGFSLSSYGSGVSTVEPFLIDEKKITEKHIVFWVEKRLAAQGIIPVWRG